MSTSAFPSPEISQKGLRRNVFAGAIGVLVHWFDWAIYAYLATTISHVFFPQQSDSAALLSVFAVFAVAFFVRPLGSLIFGHLGDTLGRKKTLSLVIIMMAAGTLMLGLIPSYETIGIWAPVLLVIARIIQGIAAGGEFGSAAAFLAEYSPPKKRGFGCSWIEFGSVLGFLLASVVVAGMHATVSTESIEAGVWRIPFLLTVPLAAVGLYIRLKIEDTPEYKALQEMETVSSAPIAEVFRNNKTQFFQTIGIEIFMNCTFYVVLVYLITYQESMVGMSAGQAATLSTVASLTAIAIIPGAGILSDRIGRKPVLITAGILLVSLAWPLFTYMNVGTPIAGFISTFGLAAILSLILGTHASTVAELFPTRTRQSGLSMAYSIAGAFFAGTLPYLNTWLIGATDNHMIPAYTLMVVGAVGLVTLSTMPETRGRNLLHDSDTAPATTPIRTEVVIRQTEGV
ncbi:MFS transporter [Corynebacterium sp. YIM 101645]|uniref:MFS transporter n=1 Tax=Corynebacterium lemuris TaxID=1859292 RepID=A0ABT2G299_9CORY|nr:MFS transporter [Corynebacterium lemuris]MCS5480858.1 MFS transporter [Corynebacterium lemuris]